MIVRLSKNMESEVDNESKPVTEKETVEYSNDSLICAVSSMQGWRKSHQDGYNCILDYDTNTSYFAVYDGHSGCEVAIYCSKYLPEFIKHSDAYKNGEIKRALEEAFLEFDATLTTPDVIEKLKEFVQEPVKKKLKSSSKKKRWSNQWGSNSENEEKDLEKSDSEEPPIKDSSFTIDTTGDTISIPTPKKEIDNLNTSESVQMEVLGNPAGDNISNSDDNKTNTEVPSTCTQDACLSVSQEEGDGVKTYEMKKSSDDEKNPVEEKVKKTPGFNSGTTVVVALLRGDKLYVASVGDSRCIISRNGKAMEMSLDHKPDHMGERDRIVKAGGEVRFFRVNGKLNLSRAIGDHKYKQNNDLSNLEQMIIALPDIMTLTIDPNRDEFFFLGCDGVWNCPGMSIQKAVDFIRPAIQEEGKKLSQICEEMLDKCLTSRDNVTAIIVQFKSYTWKRPSEESGANKMSISEKNLNANIKLKTEVNSGSSAASNAIQKTEEHKDTNLPSNTQLKTEEHLDTSNVFNTILKTENQPDTSAVSHTLLKTEEQTDASAVKI